MKVNFSIKSFAKLFRILKVSEYRKYLSSGVAAAIEHDDMVKNLLIKCVFDVGANVGQFSLVVLRHHSNCEIHAFEPLNTAAEKYESNFGELENVHIHQCALGEKEERAQINISGHDDSSSLLPITEEQVSEYPGTQKVGVQNVAVVPIRQFVHQVTAEPALLKIDVQGYEMQVLSDMQSIKNVFQWIYVEVSFKEYYEGQPLATEVVNHVLSKGYCIFGIYNCVYTNAGICSQADILFKRLDTALDHSSKNS